MSTTSTSTSTFNVDALRVAATKVREASETSAAANVAHVKDLMGQLAQRTLDNMPPQEHLAKLAEQGKSSTVIATAKPPSKHTEIHGGKPVTIFKFPANETHFAGYSPNESTDHEKNGLPLVALFQGWLKDGHGRADPSTLPDGKTLAMVIMKPLLDLAGGDPNKAMVARTIWNKPLQRCELHLVWDEYGWDKWQRGIAERSEKFKERTQRSHSQGAAHDVSRRTTTQFPIDHHVPQGQRRRAARDSRAAASP
jgi:hypothetical protein